MVDKNDILKLYNDGLPLAEIGRKYGVSRQRIWQVVKPFSDQIIFRTPRMSISHSRPEELFIIDKLKSLGIIASPQGYNNPFDLLIGNKRIEIKYRTTGDIKGGTERLYYDFHYLKDKIPVDFYIFICGILPTSDFYIIPASEVRSHVTIPIDPIHKTKRIRKYLNNWKLLS